jgi:hypothetical protein
MQTSKGPNVRLHLLSLQTPILSGRVVVGSFLLSIRCILLDTRGILLNPRWDKSVLGLVGPSSYALTILRAHVIN